MKKYFIYIAGIFAFTLIHQSCTTTVEQAVSTGKNAEVLIYMDTKLWQSELGDSLSKIFMQPAEGLNQPEPLFRLLHLESLDDLFKKHRNILRIVVSDTVKKPILQYSDNVFSKPQTYVEAYASSSEEMIALIHKAQSSLFEKFRQTDYARIQRAFKMQESIPIQNKIKNTFNVSMVIPKSFYVAKEAPDFMWLRLETNRYSQGLMIYKTEFSDSSMLQPQNLISWKNRMTELHIPGEVEGSYMRTDTLITPIINTVQWRNKKVIEIRGLWITIGDYMGGPFVTLFMTDPDLKHLYGFDAYVYYPSRDKRDLLLQLESILHSVRFDK